MPTHKPLPKANIDWTKLPKDAHVVQVRHSFVATLADGKKATVFWGSRDERAAMRFLDGRVAASHAPDPSRRRAPARKTTRKAAPTSRRARR